MAEVVCKGESNTFIIIIINPLTARVVGAPQIILQPVFSIFPCSPLPSGTCWNSRPVHSLMLSSLLFFCLPCHLPPFTVFCKMDFVRRDEPQTYPCDDCERHLTKRSFIVLNVIAISHPHRVFECCWWCYFE